METFTNHRQQKVQPIPVHELNEIAQHKMPEMVWPEGVVHSLVERILAPLGEHDDPFATMPIVLQHTVSTYAKSASVHVKPRPPTLAGYLP